MKKTVLLCFATLFAGVISLAGYDLSQESNRKTPDLRLVGDPVKIDRLGVWNVWPNYAGIEFLHQKLTGEPVEFIFNFSPADTSIAWLDGHLFSLNDAQGNEVLRIDMVRRGRFRLHWAGKKALSRYQDWRCTVINWENLTPRDLTVKIADGSAALIGDGKTILKLDGGKLPMKCGPRPTARFRRRSRCRANRSGRRASMRWRNSSSLRRWTLLNAIRS